jgi:Zn-dependent protease with chaperone function
VNKNSEIEKLAKRIRKAQIVGANLGIILVIILALLGVKPWIAIAVVFIPISTIVGLLGHQLGKKLGIPEIQFKPALSKKDVAILLLLFIVDLGIFIFISKILSMLFFLFVFLPYGYKLRAKWVSRLKETVKSEKKEEFEKAVKEIK